MRQQSKDELMQKVVENDREIQKLFAQIWTTFIQLLKRRFTISSF
jgi:hypothetical protein